MILGIIPARFKSSRFPGKVLADILGKSLVRRTWERASACRSLSEIIVAVDSEEVYRHVQDFGGKAVMTPVECESGSDRAAYVVASEAVSATHIVNIQADEPLLNPDHIDCLVQEHLRREQAPLMTLVAPLNSSDLIQSPSVAKCVFDKNQRALYFSRLPIPFSRKAEATYYRHMGIYSFQRDFLLEYARLPSTPCRESEDLEQLKAMENGYSIYVTLVEESSSVEVNEPADIARVKQVLEGVPC